MSEVMEKETPSGEETVSTPEAAPAKVGKRLMHITAANRTAKMRFVSFINLTSAHFSFWFHYSTN